MFWNMPIMFCRCSGDMFCIIFIAAAGSMVAGCCRSPCPAATTWVKVALAIHFCATSDVDSGTTCVQRGLQRVEVGLPTLLA